MWILKVLGIALAALLLYLLFLFVCSLFVSPKREYEAHSRFYRGLLNTATAIGLKIVRIRVHTTGIEKIPTDTKDLLFVGNHRSRFDPIVSWYVLRRWQPAYISKPSNFRVPIFGRIIRKCCFLAIDRENPRNALKTVNRAAGLLKRGEVSVGVYPEGTRSKTGALLPFHNGVFKIAQKAGASIAVLSVRGTEKVRQNYPLHATDVFVDVLGVLPADAIKAARTDTIGIQVRSLLAQQLQEPSEVRA